MTIEQFYVLCRGNIEDASQRIPSRSLMFKLIKMFADDSSKSNLDEAIKKMDAVEAFKAVHTLKGVCLSLGIESLSGVSNELCELLRPGAFADGWECQYNKLCAEYDKVIDAIKTLEDA